MMPMRILISKSMIYSSPNTITATTVVGGGAGGNGGQQSQLAGGGGGSGEIIYQYTINPPIPPNTNINVIIGYGGTGGQGGLSSNPPTSGQPGGPTTISWPAENPIFTITANGAPSPPIISGNWSNGGNGAPIGTLLYSSSAGGGGAAGGIGGMGSTGGFNGEAGPSRESRGKIRSGSGNGVEMNYPNGGFNILVPNTGLSYYGGGGGAWSDTTPYPPNGGYGLGKMIMPTTGPTGAADGYLYGGGGGGGASFGPNPVTDVTLLNGGNGAQGVVVFHEF